jgi:hypothetical protein
VRLAVGNSGATTGDVLSVSNTGLSVTGTLSATGNVTLGDATTDTITLTGTVQPGVVISGSSSGDALRITQTGTGNALLVEDSSNPDSTPFVVTAAGDVGIGTTSPGQKLVVSGSGAQRFDIIDTGGATGRISTASGTVFVGTTTNHPLSLFTNDVGRVLIDTSGNLGLGVTPSGWASTYRAYQVGQAGSLFGLTNDQDRVGVSSNAYFDTTDSRWEYIGTGYAMRYDQNAGEHQWYTAASGAANGAITFTQAMTLDASGNLGVGNTNPSAPVDIQANSGGTGIRIRGRASSNTGALRFFANDNTTQRARFESNDTNFEINSIANLPIIISTNDTERARITSGGIFQVDSVVSSATDLSTTNPLRIYTGTSTFTDTGAAGTRTHGTIVAFDNPAIAATNATVTYTNASTVYIDGAPTAGSNAAITNAYALYINAGNVSAAGVYSATVGGTNRDVYVDNTGLIGYVSSTRASKTNITNITDANWLLQLNPVSFNYRKKDEAGNYTEEADGPIEFGLIAEDTEAIKPELCFYDDVDGKQELRGISYSKLITPMLKLLQEQQALITSLTARVAALEGTQP